MLGKYSFLRVSRETILQHLCAMLYAFANLIDPITTLKRKEIFFVEIKTILAKLLDNALSNYSSDKHRTQATIIILF